jgi:hypothetical protein
LARGVSKEKLLSSSKFKLAILTWIIALRDRLIVVHLIRKFPVVEPEGSFLSSKELTMGPYLESHVSILHPDRIYFISIL